MEVLAKVILVLMLIFVVSSMLGVGLSLTIKQIAAPLRDARLVILALTANFVLVPLAAFAIARLLKLEHSLGVGLLLLGTAAGAPFLPKLVSVAQGDLARSVGLMVLLMVLTVGYMPLVLPLVLEGVSVDPMNIAKSLVVLMLLPLAAGLLGKARLGSTAAQGAAMFNKISTLSLGVMIVLLVVTNISNIVDLFGSRGLLASVVFLFAGLAIGWLLGGTGAPGKSVLALGTAQRNIAAALVVGGQNFDDKKVVVMIVVVAIIGIVVLFPFAVVIAKRNK